MPTITIKGKQYTADIDGLKVIPLATVMGLDDRGVPLTTDTENFSDLLLRRMGEPINHHKIAYSLRAIVPDLPINLADYRCSVRSDGTREEFGTLGLGVMEIVEIFAQLQPFMGKPVEAPMNGSRISEAERDLLAAVEDVNRQKARSNGYGKPANRSQRRKANQAAKERALELAHLEKRIAELKAAV